MENFIEICDGYIKVREATKQGYAIAMEGDSINLEQPNSKTRRERIGKQIANTLTCSCNQGVVIEVNKIIREIIPQIVKVRKYDVDVNNLKKLLKEHKKISKLSNKDIAIKLNKPLTLVEHWFRNDNSFSIPNEDTWLKLKELLNITTDEFDKSILTFEFREGVFDKSNRVYSDEGVAPTITCVSAGNEKIKISKGDEFMSIPKLVGGVGEINFGKQFRQGNRIYDANEVAMCLMAQPVGNTGGYSYLYQIEDKGDRIMWENKLEKLDFKMDELRVFDVFSGIGSLHKSLKKLGVPVKVTNISEIDCDAIISYAGVHIENFKDLEFEYPSDQEMKDFLMGRNIGYSYEKGKSSIPRMKNNKLKLVYKASVLLNNLGDISKINYKEIEDFDLMNFSFSCTDLSGAGKQKGMRNEDGTPTRSGLYVYGVKAIREKMPKYIMIENVKGLIQKKFLDDFYSIVDELNDIGYNCYYPTKEDKKGNKTPTCLNAKDFGIPQNRERIYVICVRKDVDDGNFEFPIGKDFDFRLKDLLQDEVDGKYYLSPEIQNKIHNWNAYQRPFENVLGEKSISPTLTARGAGEYHSGMIIIGSNLENNTNLEKDGEITYDKTLDKELRFFKDDIKDEIKIRKLTPKECWRLMGFDDEDFDNAQALEISDSQLYKQSGNSIVVNVLYYIFKNLFEEYIIKNEK